MCRISLYVVVVVVDVVVVVPCLLQAMGYWTYELCHGIHVRQFHEAKEQKKEPRKPGVGFFRGRLLQG